MNETKIYELFNSITVWRRGGQRAPNKPLLLLMALAKLQSGYDRLIPYELFELTPKKWTPS